MFSLLLYLIGCYGITMIIVQSKITKPIRSLVNVIKHLSYFINCMHCVGFWVGVLTSILFEYSVTNTLIFTNRTPAKIDEFLYIVFDASIISCVIWFLYLIQLNLERYVKSEL